VIVDADLEIRAAGPTEAGLIARIVQESFRAQAEMQGIRADQYPKYVAFTDEAAVLKALEKGHNAALLYHGAEPIGGIWHALDWNDPLLGHVSKLAVLPAHRGWGYGKMLFAYAEDKLRALGAQHARLTCNARLTGLRAYYERLGYRVVKQEPWPTLPFEVLMMEKEL
jgi:GNAT superfamily N-acetyltransferase